MTENKGYDDTFNNALYRTTFLTSRQQRPNMWPISITKQRGMTSYENHGLTPDHLDAPAHQYSSGFVSQGDWGFSDTN